MTSRVGWDWFLSSTNAQTYPAEGWGANTTTVGDTQAPAGTPVLLHSITLVTKDSTSAATILVEDSAGNTYFELDYSASSANYTPITATLDIRLDDGLSVISSSADFVVLVSFSIIAGASEVGPYSMRTLPHTERPDADAAP